MAHPEHLAILERGIEAWNDWRDDSRNLIPNLSDANLSGANLSQINFSGVNLNRANLSGAILNRADLYNAELNAAALGNIDLNHSNLLSAELHRADLRIADVSNANLTDAILTRADLEGANLQHVNASDANLSYADLSFANLTDAYLIGVNLHRAKFDRANVSHAVFGNTFLTVVDLRNIEGLEKTTHQGPSEVSLSTLSRSRGRIPMSFLRGCGLKDWEIEAAKLYQPDLRSLDQWERCASGLKSGSSLYRSYVLFSRLEKSVADSPERISFTSACRTIIKCSRLLASSSSE